MWGYYVSPRWFSRSLSDCNRSEERQCLGQGSFGDAQQGDKDCPGPRGRQLRYIQGEAASGFLDHRLWCQLLSPSLQVWHCTSLQLSLILTVQRICCLAEVWSLCFPIPLWHRVDDVSFLLPFTCAISLNYHLSLSTHSCLLCVHTVSNNMGLCTPLQLLNIIIT